MQFFWKVSNRKNNCKNISNQQVRLIISIFYSPVVSLPLLKNLCLFCVSFLDAGTQISKDRTFILKERWCAHQKEVISYHIYFKDKPLLFLPIHFTSIFLLKKRVMVIKHNFALGASAMPIHSAEDISFHCY